MSTQFPLQRSAYELKKLIGRGATSDVYTAKCLTNGQEIAVKVINLETCPIEIETLRSEVAFWSTCNHPNVVKYYGSFIDKATLYILMEYMNGGSCYEIMRFAYKKGFTSEKYIATILYEVLKSLAYFHENRQMHRDVKAGNILMNDKGEVKIADFGIAANLVEQGQRKRARFTVIGTPCYMAPEILAGGNGYTEKADIWALGITAIELATGSAPYSDLYPLEVIVRISNSPPPTLPDEGKFTGPFKDFVKACLQQAPGKRASAKELLETKFMKQRVPLADLATGLLKALPPLDERFAAVHDGVKGKEHEQEASPAKATTEWDFGDLGTKKEETTEAKPAASEQHVVKKGRFTISGTAPKEAPPAAAPHPESPRVEADEKKIAAMEEEIVQLKQRIETLVAENQGLRQQVITLASQIKALATES